MKTLLYTLGFILVGLVLLRLTPVDVDDFHIDPSEPEKRISKFRLIGREAPRYPASADQALEAFAKIATGDFNVQRVRGNVDEGMMTFMARSHVFGFRDFITVKSVDEPEGAKLSIYARPRANVYDWGVNKKRLDRWMAKLEQTFAQ